VCEVSGCFVEIVYAVVFAVDISFFEELVTLLVAAHERKDQAVVDVEEKLSFSSGFGRMSAQCQERLVKITFLKFFIKSKIRLIIGSAGACKEKRCEYRPRFFRNRCL